MVGRVWKRKVISDLLLLPCVPCFLLAPSTASLAAAAAGTCWLPADLHPSVKDQGCTTHHHSPAVREMQNFSHCRKGLHLMPGQQSQQPAQCEKNGQLILCHRLCS